MQFSYSYILSGDQQSIPFLFADRQDVHFEAHFIDVIQDSKAIVRAKADFPSSRKCRRLAERFPVPGFDGRLDVTIQPAAAKAA
jgi:hypothetical protein